MPEANELRLIRNAAAVNLGQQQGCNERGTSLESGEGCGCIALPTRSGKMRGNPRMNLRDTNKRTLTNTGTFGPTVVSILDIFGREGLKALACALIAAHLFTVSAIIRDLHVMICSGSGSTEREQGGRVDDKFQTDSILFGSGCYMI